jgi:hypothetical protein
MAMPASTRSGVVPVQTPRRAAPGDAGGRPAQHAAQAAHEHRQAAATPHPEPHPRSLPGQLEGQLPAQHHDGAQVLERGGEAQLPHEGGAPLGGLHGHVAGEREAHDHQDRRDGDGHQAEGVELERPQQQAPERRGRAGGQHVGAVEHRDRDQAHAEERGEPAGQAQATGDVGRAHREADQRDAAEGTGADPAERVAREAVRGQLPADAPGDQADEGVEAQLLDGRCPQGRPAVDRGQQHVAHLRLLERQGPTAAAGAQAHRDRHCGEAAEPPRPVPEDVVQAPLVDVAVTDGARRDDDEDEADDPGQVRLVHRVDPVDLADALLPSEAAPLDERVLQISVRIGPQHEERRYVGSPVAG